RCREPAQVLEGALAWAALREGRRCGQDLGKELEASFSVAHGSPYVEAGRAMLAQVTGSPLSCVIRRLPKASGEFEGAAQLDRPSRSGAARARRALRARRRAHGPRRKSLPPSRVGQERAPIPVRRPRPLAGFSRAQ